MNRPRALLADDHLLILEALKSIIERECQIVGTAGDGRQLLALAAELKPEIVFLDVAMPLLNGIEACRQLKAADEQVKIIFVTMQLSREYVREAFDAGASAYVLKQAAGTELLAAISAVRSGRFFVASLLSEQFLSRPFVPGENPSKLFNTLTCRQREVLQLVAEGKSAKEIGALLEISVKTVEFHKKHLMDELRVRTSAELVRYAVQHGWVAQ